MEPMGLYWNAERGEVRKRVPAGGVGGGVTCQVDEVADADEAAAWLAANAPKPEEESAEPEAPAEPAAESEHPAEPA